MAHSAALALEGSLVELQQESDVTASSAQAADAALADRWAALERGEHAALAALAAHEAAKDAASAAAERRHDALEDAWRALDAASAQRQHAHTAALADAQERKDTLEGRCAALSDELRALTERERALRQRQRAVDGSAAVAVSLDAQRLARLVDELHRREAALERTLAGGAAGPT